jgi:hypothetical protein
VQDSPPSGAGLAGGRPTSILKSAPMVGGGPLPKGRGGFAPYKRRGLLPILRAKENNRGKATPWPPTLLAVRGERDGGKPLGNNPEQVLNLGYCLAVAGFPTLAWGCGPLTKIKNAVFLCEGHRKSLRWPSGFDPEFMCCFLGLPFGVLILSSVWPVGAEAVVFKFFPGEVDPADINVDLIAVVVPCRCVSACVCQLGVQHCSALCVVRRGGVGSNGACQYSRVGRSNDDGSSMAVVRIIECVFFLRV